MSNNGGVGVSDLCLQRPGYLADLQCFCFNRVDAGGDTGDVLRLYAQAHGVMFLPPRHIPGAVAAAAISFMD